MCVHPLFICEVNVEKNFVTLHAFEGLVSQGLRPDRLQVDKLRDGGYRITAIVINMHRDIIENAEIVKEDYRLKSLKRSHRKE